MSHAAAPPVVQGSGKLEAARQKARLARRHYSAAPCPPRGDSCEIAIIGAGPVGLTLACELRRYGISVVLLDRNASSSDGSRAICWSKRSLEILDRHGVAEAMVARGVTWNIGRVFEGARTDPLYSFDLLPIKDQKFPAFVNLQQYHVEEALVDVLAKDAHVALRWQHSVQEVSVAAEGVRLEVDSPGGRYSLQARFIVAADGHRSTVRDLMRLDFSGRTFEDNFLIADVKVDTPFPAERRFYFNAPFNDGRTALMHQQPEGLWRLDFQLGWDIDREAAVSEPEVDRRVRAMLGTDTPFEYEWVSLYTFQCRRMERFVHGPVIFAGDAAHLVSPFGARGANGGLQDADSLGWRLARVLRGESSAELLEAYNEERCHGADENLLNSSRATDFMTPRSPGARALQAAVLSLATDLPFARNLINSGRLSVPCSLMGTRAITPDTEVESMPGPRPGEVALDAPIRIQGREAWLLSLLGPHFTCLCVNAEIPDPLPPEVRALRCGQDFVDPDGRFAERYSGGESAIYLIRPDQHVAARFRQATAQELHEAWCRSLAPMN